MDITTIHRYLSGECTDAECRKVEKWLEERSLNREHFKFLKKIWDTEIENPVNFDSEEGLRKIQEQLSAQITERSETISPLSESSEFANISDISKKESTKQFEKGGFSTSLFYKIAAVLLVGIIGIGLVFYLSEQQTEIEEEFVQNNLPEVQSFETMRGEINRVVLKEGIQVKMNASSSIEVFSDEAKDQVILEGEAYFDIERAEDDFREFIVQSNSVTVNVIGTKFNVRNRAELQTTEVVVQKGMVRIELFDELSNSETVILNKGERFVYSETDKRFWVQDQVNLDDLLLWMNGGLYFENTPLSEVLNSLENRYDVDFIVSDSAPLKRPFSARFTNEELPEILQITALTLGFEFEKVEEGLFEIYN